MNETFWPVSRTCTAQTIMDKENSGATDESTFSGKIAVTSMCVFKHMILKHISKVSDWILDLNTASRSDSVIFLQFQK